MCRININLVKEKKMNTEKHIVYIFMMKYFLQLVPKEKAVKKKK